MMCSLDHLTRKKCELRLSSFVHRVIVTSVISKQFHNLFGVGIIGQEGTGLGSFGNNVVMKLLVLHKTVIAVVPALCNRQRSRGQAQL